MGGRPLDDLELVDRAKTGDVHAYEELVRRHESVAHRAACLIVGNTGEAEDAVQEAFVKAYYALDRFRHDAPFRPWLLRIVSNEAHNVRRRTRRQGNLALRAAEDRRRGDAAPSPEAAALVIEGRTSLLEALNRLPEKDRLTLALRFFLDLSEREMAAALRCPRGTVKSRLSRALSRLRKQIDDPTMLDVYSTEGGVADG